MSYHFTFPYVDGGECMAIGIALPAVCTIIVGVRFWIRKTQKTGFGADDWLTFASLIWIMGMGICFIYGAAKHVMGWPGTPTPPDLTADEVEHYISPSYELLEKIEYPFQIFLMLAYGCIKMSVVAFYRRLFVVQTNSLFKKTAFKRSSFDIVTLFTQVIIFLWTLTYLLVIIFPCGKNIWANWGSTADQLRLCPIIFTEEYGLVISDLILDLHIFALPLPMIWGLSLTTSKKIAVSGILLLAASAVGASIARLVLYVEVLNADPSTFSDTDENLILALSLWWSLLECGLALIAACLPTFSFLLRRFSLRGVLVSVRSMFSLSSGVSGSKMSGAHATQPTSRGWSDIKSVHSGDSQRAMFRSSSIDFDIESHAMDAI